MHYLLLSGGISPEKDVSNRSASAVHQALEALGHSVKQLDPADTSLDQLLQEAHQTDGVFPILHGIGGEDGAIQAHLEKVGTPLLRPKRRILRGNVRQGHL